MSEFDIPFIKPFFPPPSAIAHDIEEIVGANWYTNFGPFERNFVQEIEDYLRQDICAASFANGTLALIAGIDAAIGHGNLSKFVLMPAFTFAAVPQAAIWNGYRPWFIDIDACTWHMRLDAAREALRVARDQVAGVLLPNAFGVGNPDISEWEALSREFDIPIVIDSAAGFGSRYKDGNLLGARGTCEIFSFHSTKPFGIGEGGALVSRNRDLVDAVHDIQNFGFDDSRICTQLGFNAKLSEISAAIGRRQLPGFDARLTSRRKTYDAYVSAFVGTDLKFQANAEISSQFCANILTNSPEEKAAALTSLAVHRVQARDYYNPPLHFHPYFRSTPDLCRVDDLPVTETVCSQIVSLPIHDDMPPEEIDRVAHAVTVGLTS